MGVYPAISHFDGTFHVNKPIYFRVPPFQGAPIYWNIDIRPGRPVMDQIIVYYCTTGPENRWFSNILVIVKPFMSMFLVCVSISPICTNPPLKLHILGPLHGSKSVSIPCFPYFRSLPSLLLWSFQLLQTRRSWHRLWNTLTSEPHRLWMHPEEVRTRRSNTFSWSSKSMLANPFGQWTLF